MNNGLAIIEKTDNSTKSIYIDQESIECAKLNARTKERIATAKKAKHETEKKKAAKMALAQKNLRYILIRTAITAASALGCVAGLIHPAIFFCVAMYCLCTSCVRFGAWIEKAVKK